MEPRTQRLLVVDGDSEIRDVVEDLLFERGFSIHQAADATQAALEMQQNDFDVLLCHFTLLGSVLGQLCRSTNKTKTPPRIVAMSASGAQAPSEEASANLPKPFTRMQLLQALRGC